jgi:hypothetical protein
MHNSHNRSWPPSNPSVFPHARPLPVKPRTLYGRSALRSFGHFAGLRGIGLQSLGRIVGMSETEPHSGKLPKEKQVLPSVY